MSLPAFLLGPVLLAMSSPAAPCAGARVGPQVASAPPIWRNQVEALARLTGEPGAPWSCVGGEVDLVRTETGFLLVVTSAEGNIVSRALESPEDVEPLGEALLAKPLPMPEPTETPPPEAEPAPEPAPETPSKPENETTKPEEPPRAVRVYVSATMEPRYADGLGFGARATAVLPFGAWGGGVWLRFSKVGLAPRAIPVNELSLGALASRSFGLGKLELRGSILPSLALMTKRPERDEATLDDTREAAEQGHFDFRLGARAEAIWPFNGTLRGIVALDGEVSPDVFERHGAKDTLEAGFPSYSLGFGLGLEVAIR